MHVAYLNFIPDSDSSEVESYLKESHLPLNLYQDIRNTYSIDLSIIQRALFSTSTIVDDISYYFISDEFKSELRWWQEPESTLQAVAKSNPDIIHVIGLDLPLQFRWLRRIIGEKVIIIGEHTGKTFWAQRNLWLQQFGLRVVDGFIFKNISDAQAWIKASVILERQPFITIPSLNKNIKDSAKSLIKFYNELKK